MSERDERDEIAELRAEVNRLRHERDTRWKRRWDAAFDWAEALAAWIPLLLSIGGCGLLVFAIIQIIFF